MTHSRYLPPNLQSQVIQAVEDCYLHAEAFFQRSFLRPEISFNQRGKTAGSARLQSQQLRFNPVLLKDNVDMFLSDVIPHEVSHLLVYQLFGRTRPHGQEWRHIMRQVFACEPRTTHAMDISKVAGKTFDYRCGCGVIALSIRRHNKVMRGQQQYRCRTCGEILLYATTHC